MKNKVLEAFNELGFKLEMMEDVGYAFDYEGINYLYVPHAEDENFLNIAIPGIHDLDEENALAVYKLISELNSTLRYIKASQLGNSLWLFYERELYAEEDLLQIISRMILHLEAALFFVRKTVAAGSGENPQAEDETDHENSTETED